MATRTKVIVRNDRILGGDPVFAGTRVLVRSLFEYLEAGDKIETFLEQFPDVRRDQAIAALDEAEQRLLDANG